MQVTYEGSEEEGQKECLTSAAGIDYKKPAPHAIMCVMGSAVVGDGHCVQSIRTGIEVKFIGRGHHSRE
jgi:hypothetical protein